MCICKLNAEIQTTIPIEMLLEVITGFKIIPSKAIVPISGLKIQADG